MGRWVWALGPVFCYGALIVYFSSRTTLPSVPVWDKAAHFGQYAILGLLLSRAALMLTEGRRPFRAALYAAGVATAFGVTDEFHQYFVPGRDASLGDLLADGMGSVVGAGAYYLAWLLVRRVRAERIRE